MQPDEIDWKIIEILRDGHKNNNAIARELGVSEGMIRQRLKKLKESGVITIKALINPDVLENKQLATVAVSLSDPASLEKKAIELSKFKEVLSVSVSSGRYDMMVEVLVDSNHGLVRFLTETMSAVQGISATETFVILKSYGKYV